MSKIVDFFPYFDPTGKEILELRYNIMKDYVDEFVICESNKTQSGKPIEYGLRKTLEDLQIPQDKIKIIESIFSIHPSSMKPVTNTVWCGQSYTLSTS